MEYFTAVALGALGLSSFCIYARREWANEEAIERDYKEFVRDDRTKDIAHERVHQSAVNEYVGRLNVMTILTPLARRTRKRTIKRMKEQV